MSDAGAREPADQMGPVLEAWRQSQGSSWFGAPADEATIAQVELTLGRPLPPALKSLYRLSDGMAPLDGNLMIEPMSGAVDRGLVGLAERLRGWDWPIPDELLVFGGNGGDDQFGLWYPQGASASDPTPVVMVGAVFEPACLALVGTDLPRFLRAWSGYYLVQGSSPAPALDALELPAELRVIDDAAGLEPYFRWADPDLPDPDPDPYAKGLDARSLAEIIHAL